MITINGNPITINGNFINDIVIDPLPPYTLRLKFRNGVTPTFSKGTGIQVSSSPNIWDLTYENSDWTDLLSYQYDLLEVIGVGNTSNVTNMENMFFMLFGRASLTSVPLFDTSNVTNMSNMFRNCHSLTAVPLFDTSKVTNMQSMFNECINVQSGALALYQQASTQTTPPTIYNACFRNCGRDTVEGWAELAQIPTSWGGRK